jgi:7-cyano-7-deazaguanine synthase in queuosine biosynthesis
MTPTTVLLNSGGLDTLWCAEYLVRQQRPFVTLFFHLGHSGHDTTTRQASQALAHYYQVPWSEIRVTGLTPGLYPGAPFARVPFQTQLLLPLAASWMVAQQLTHLVTGAKAPMMGQTLALMTATLQENALTPYPIVFEAPCANLTTTAVHHSLLGHPFLPQTVSCNDDPRCGTCPKCRHRSLHGLD